MTSPPVAYTRLPGRGLRTPLVGARCRLWLGPDHLLSVESTGYVETYKRFYYRDIQALAVGRTPRLAARLVAAAAIAALLALGAAIDPAALVFFAVLASPIAAYLVADLMRGPTCVCHLRTAVQTERLASLGRVRAAERALAEIVPRVVAAQGALDLSALGGLPAPPPSLAPGSRPAAADPAAPAQELPDAAPRHDRGAVHLWLFASLVVSAGIGLVQIPLVSTALDALGLLVALGSLGLFVASVVRHRGSDLPRGVRRLAWAALALVVAEIYAGLAYGVYAAMAALSRGAAPEVPRPADEPLLLVLLLGSAAAGLAMGLVGTARVLRHRRAAAGQAA